MAQEKFKRKLTTIFSADVAGYSRLMGQDEAATVKTLEQYKGIMAELIRQHRGRVVDSPGDNLLAEFPSVVDAVQCAVAVQKELKSRNTELPENRKMQFRIGINLGDVIEEESRIYGDGVNIAARLESLADPGGICVSKTAFDQIETKLPFGYHYLGEQSVKNIAKAVGAYRVLMEPRVTVAGARAPKVPLWRHKTVLPSAMVALVAIIGVGVSNCYWRAPKIEPASKEKMAFPLPDVPSIAVLPFVNRSEDSIAISATSYTPVQYTSGDNKSYTLYAVPGRNVALLVDSNTYDINIISTFVDKLDMAYDFYKQITEKVPTNYKTYNGLLSIAVINSNPCNGLACSYMGFTGIEILQSYFQLTYQYIRDQNLYESALFYELGRNFWFYNDQVGTQIWPFVTGFAVVNRYLSMEYANVQGITFYGTNTDFETLKNNILNNMSYLYFNDKSLDWTNTLATNTPPTNPYNLDCVCLAASLFYRIYLDFGSLVYSNFFKSLSTLPISYTQLSAIENFTSAYQLATGTSHGCSLLKFGFKIYTNDGTKANFTINNVDTASAYYGYSGDVSISSANPRCDIFAGSGNNTITIFANKYPGERIISCGSGNDSVRFYNAKNNSQAIKFFMCNKVIPINTIPSLGAIIELLMNN